MDFHQVPDEEVIAILAGYKPKPAEKAKATEAKKARKPRKATKAKRAKETKKAPAPADQSAL
jgi:hypothetical protein